MEIEQPFSLTIPIDVADGGTGLSSLVPYAVLTGGTTATSPMQQVSGVGTSGQVLVSNGPSTLPTWQTIAEGGGTVTNVASADGSINVTNPTTTVDLSVVKAPKLTTARNINGVAFDGTASITVTAAAGTLTGTTLNATVVTSSLTTIGTIGTGIWQGTKIGLTYGGTNADLSATGGTSQYLKQSSSGAAITVGTIPASDIASGAALTKTDDTNVTLTLGGAPTTALLTAASLTLGWTGTLAVARGGTGGGSASITLFNNITGYSAAGATGTTSTNLVFSTSPTLTNPVVGTQTSSDNSTLAASTAYVTTAITNALNGLDWKPAVGYATTANVVGTNVAGVFTYTATGVDTIDGHTLALNDVVLFKNQTTGADNGVWVVTTAGAIGIAGVLTRRSDYNVSSDIHDGDTFFVQHGTTNGGTSWVQTATVTTINTDPLVFSQVAGPGTYVAGTGLTLTGNSFSVNASQTQITAIGTIATGTWNGSIIIGTYGGTGVNNGTKTFTYLKNISFTSADDTGVYTLPTGTKTLLATDGSIGALTGTILSSVLGNSALFIGTTSIALNRATGSQALTGITSIDGSAATLTNVRTLWGQNFDGSANVSGSLTSVGDITGGASNMTITAGTGNSRTLTLRSTTSGGTATAFLTGNADQSSTFGGNISGTGAWQVTGGAGNMTIISGTGNSRTMILQTTTSGGTATTALTLNADQSATFAAGATLAGTLVMGANSITMTGSLAATGARVTKGWFTDVESTNMYTVGGTSLTTVSQSFQNKTITNSNNTLGGVTMGLGSDAVGDIYAATTSNVLSRIAAVATGNALISGGVTTLPSWGKIGLTTHISGVLPIANGGTNSSAALSNQAVMTSVGGAIVESGAITDGEGIQRNNTTFVDAPIVILPQGRLTLTSGTPVTTSDVTAATIVYFALFNGDYVSLYDGTRWKAQRFTEQLIHVTVSPTGNTHNGTKIIDNLGDTSQLVRGMKVSGTNVGVGAVISTIDSSTQVTVSVNSTGTTTTTITFKCPASTNYDIFYVQSSGKLQFSNAWTSNTARADALTTQNGLNVNNAIISSGDSNSIAAKTGILLGSIRTTTTDGQTEDSVTNRFVSNVFNTVPRSLLAQPGYVDDNTVTSYTLNSTTFIELNGGTGSRFNFFCSVPNMIHETFTLVGDVGASAGNITAGPGLDSATTALTAIIGNGPNTRVFAACSLDEEVAIGFHFVAMLGHSTTAFNTTIYADLLRSGGTTDPRATFQKGWILN